MDLKSERDQKIKIELARRRGRTRLMETVGVLKERNLPIVTTFRRKPSAVEGKDGSRFRIRPAPIHPINRLALNRRYHTDRVRVFRAE